MPNKIRIYTDENVSRAVIRGLRQLQIDVLTVPEAALMGAADSVHVERATSDGRVILTQDQDFLQLCLESASHCGLIFAGDSMSIGEIVQGVELICEVLYAEDMLGHVEYL
jgi:predicted nuclease of predicted toxin-antitoxin system